MSSWKYWSTLLATLHVSSSDPLQVEVTLDTESRLSVTGDSFICVDVDWWPHNKCDYGWCPWGKAGILNLDLENPALISALKALSAESAVHLRIGGSLADVITYQVKGDEECHELRPTNTTRLGWDLKGTCLPMSRWEAVHKMCETAGCNILFGVNALKGREFHGCAEDPRYGKEFDCHTTHADCCYNFTTPWNGDNAKDFFQYTASKLSHYPPPYALEFGNEVAGQYGIQARLSVQDYARDFKLFSKLIREAWPSRTPKLVAADTNFDKDWVSQFIDLVDGDFDIFTHHQYFLGPGVSPQLPSKIMNPQYLDKIKPFGAQIQKELRAKAPKAQIWMGEAGGAYNSGHHLVTDAFMSAFWYLDNMANLAQRGHQAFCRQTLIGGNYGLLNTTTFAPNPDFYAALLWQRLMGQTVLTVSTTGPDGFRVYAHCTRGDRSSVTLLALNMDTNRSIVVKSLAKFSRDEYHMSSTALHSQEAILNGAKLASAPDGSIAEMKPRIVVDRKPLLISPLSYAFVVLKGVHATACAADDREVIV